MKLWRRLFLATAELKYIYWMYLTLPLPWHCGSGSVWKSSTSHCLDDTETTIMVVRVRGLADAAAELFPELPLGSRNHQLNITPFQTISNDLPYISSPWPNTQMSLQQGDFQIQTGKAGAGEPTGQGGTSQGAKGGSGNRQGSIGWERQWPSKTWWVAGQTDPGLSENSPLSPVCNIKDTIVIL